MQRKSALQQPRKPTGKNKRNEPGNVLKKNDIAKNNEPGKPGFEPGKPGFEPAKPENGTRGTREIDPPRAMTIEIQKPELEALIRQQMESGEFQNVDDLLIEALNSRLSQTETGLSSEENRRKSLFEWMDKAGPAWNLADHPELARGAAHWVDSMRREDDAIDSGGLHP
jgi:Arc/MetJ-type ribon-helix-helix transcriptional regulator